MQSDRIESGTIAWKVPVMNTSDIPNIIPIPSDIQRLFDRSPELRLISARRHAEAHHESAQVGSLNPGSEDLCQTSQVLHRQKPFKHVM